jgi:hypothetical protein
MFPSGAGTEQSGGDEVFLGNFFVTLAWKVNY